jgi:hypothetical protein
VTAPAPQGGKQPLPGWAKLVFVVLGITVAFVLLAGLLGVVVYLRMGG